MKISQISINFFKFELFDKSLRKTITIKMNQLDLENTCDKYVNVKKMIL